MSKNYKNEEFQTDAASAVSDAFAEFQALRDEMRENADNMEGAGTGLENTEKYQRTVEAADTLETVADNEPEIPVYVASLALKATRQISTRKGRAPSRAVRLSNVVGLLGFVVEALEAYSQEKEELKIDWKQSIQDIEEQLEGLEGDQLSAAKQEIAELRENIEVANDHQQEVESLRDELTNATTEVEGVEFPGFTG